MGATQVWMRRPRGKRIYSWQETNGRKVSRKLQVEVGQIYLTVQLRWKVSLCVAPMTLCREILEAGDRASHAPGCMGFAGLQQAGNVLTSGRLRAAASVAFEGFLLGGYNTVAKG